MKDFLKIMGKITISLTGILAFIGGLLSLSKSERNKITNTKNWFLKLIPWKIPWKKIK